MLENGYMIENNKKALIAMSGGVDSSVAAYVMMVAGYECVGCTMKLNDNSCANEKNVADAKAVCDKLHIPHYVVDYTERFKEKVIDNFIGCYECGRTPNPCIECNKYLKFDALMDKAFELGCEYVVTGHYAVVSYNEKTGKYELKMASDTNKDQSYFLYKLTQNQLAHVKFPLADMTKDEAREIAEKQGFITAKKKDSQDICFIPNGKYAEFIKNNSEKTYPEGDFIDINGNVLGRHKGIIRYTIGQRKGLGIALNEPMYVKKIDVEANTVMLARDEELYSSNLLADNVTFTSIEEIMEPVEVLAKIRYRHTPAKAFVKQVSSDIIKVEFSEPQRAITSGQAVVLYSGNTVIGGGTII